MVKYPFKTDTCSYCDDRHPLGDQCCGLCRFEEVCDAAQLDQLLTTLASLDINISALLPEMLFKAIMRRSLWLVGDSQMRHFYTSIECFLAQYMPSTDRSMPFPGNGALNEMMRRGTDFNIWRLSVIAHVHFPPQLIQSTQICILKQHLEAFLYLRQAVCRTCPCFESHPEERLMSRLRVLCANACW